jgi:Ca2+-transporting ATPase
LKIRSGTKPVWRIPLLSNINLALVVALSFGLQVWSHHNETLGRFLKTSIMDISECLMLLIVSAIPLAVLEVMKCTRNLRRGGASTREEVQGTPTV